MSEQKTINIKENDEARMLGNEVSEAIRLLWNEHLSKTANDDVESQHIIAAGFTQGLLDAAGNIFGMELAHGLNEKSLDDFCAMVKVLAFKVRDQHDCNDHTEAPVGTEVH